MVDAIPLD